MIRFEVVGDRPQGHPSEPTRSGVTTERYLSATALQRGSVPDGAAKPGRSPVAAGRGPDAARTGEIRWVCEV